MNNPRRPFRLNVGFIVHEEVGYKHEFPFEFEQVQISDDLLLRNFEGLVTVGRTPQGLIVQGDFSAEATLECARCLIDFDQRLNWDFTELYAFKKKSISDSDQLLPENQQIDLHPLIREYALLEVPINPICKPDCRGLCVVCGENLNEIDCGHKQTNDKLPFSALNDLLDE